MKIGHFFLAHQSLVACSPAQLSLLMKAVGAFTKFSLQEVLVVLLPVGPWEWWNHHNENISS